MSQLDISLLGPFLVTLSGQQLTGFDYDKVRALLAYLALEADRPHRREALAGLLWPEHSDKAARDSLRTALATLRRAIGDQAADPPYLHVTRESVQFNAASDHTLDAAAFARWLDHCDRHRHRNPAGCRVCAGWRAEAAAHYRGPFLAQFSLPDSPEFEAWMVARREALHRAAMDAFARLADFHLWRGDYQSAHFYAGRQLVYEPWHEAAHRQAMRALAWQGDRAAALARYRDAVRVLDEELGVEPEPATTLLAERIRDGNLEPPARPYAVAAPTSPLIGRERDLDALGERLADPDVRLVTVIGPGGVGKTSLARAAAHRFGADFADGAAFVSLAALVEPDAVASAVLAGLGLDPVAGGSPAAQLAAYLSDRDLLLVLDNFEHLPAAAPGLADLLAAAPGLVLLVTSRHRLNLAVEWLVDLTGLDFPAEGSEQPLAGFAALQLFARRARQERGDFGLLSAEAVAAAEICRLVQGMPLAVELAAAATAVRPTAEVARHLRQSLDALDAEWADLPPRHRSVRAALDHSWGLLTGDERALLRRLAVFSGGFDAEAAEAVAGANVAGLRRLRDKSLLQVAGGRFDLHPLIRTYAAEKLGVDGETDAYRRRHFDYYTQLAEAGEQALKGREQLDWLRRLETDHANLLGALDWAERAGLTAAARLAAAMWLFWFMRGHLHESRRRYEWLVQRRADLPAGLRARVLNGYASALMGQSDMQALGDVAREALDAYREAGDLEGIALSLHHLGIHLREAGRETEALARLEEGLAAARLYAASGAPYGDWIPAVLQSDLSSSYARAGRLDEAEVLIHERMRLKEVQGDRWAGAYAASHLADVYLRRGDLDRAAGRAGKALAIAREYGDRRLIAHTSQLLADLALRRDDLAAAWQHATTAEQNARDAGERLGQAEAAELLGDLLARRGFAAEAGERYAVAERLYASLSESERADGVGTKRAALGV